MACLEDITDIKEEPIEIEEHKYSCTEQFQLDTTRNQMELDISKYNLKKCFVRLERLAPQHKEQSGKNTKIQQDTQCSDCLKQFASRCGLKVHILGVHGKANVLSCPICKKKVKYLKQHITTVHSSDREMFSCSQCRATFSRKNNMKVHIESVHLGIIRYCCNVCGHKFYHKVHFDDHMRRHNRVKPFQCPICYKKFVTKWGLTQHIVIHSNKRKYRCALCPVTYNHKFRLMVHIETVHLGIRRYCCDVCSHKFYYKYSLVIHMKKHDLNKPFQCKIFDKSHLSKDSDISSNESNYYSCPKCPATFSLEENVKIHIETVHLGVTRYCCDVCSHKFCQKEKLVTHMKRHDRIKPFYCKIVDKSHLSKDSAIYSNERNYYSCPKCPATFTKKSSLKTHLESLHLGITRYCCDVCRYKFYHKSSFVVHMRRHNCDL